MCDPNTENVPRLSRSQSSHRLDATEGNSSTKNGFDCYSSANATIFKNKVYDGATAAVQLHESSNSASLQRIQVPATVTNRLGSKTNNETDEKATLVQI